MRAIIATIAATTVILGACSHKEQEAKISFAAQIKPMLDQHCVECHKADGEGYGKSGLKLDSYEGLMAGTKFGPVVKPGSSVSSSLYLLVAGKADPSIRMPHNRDPLPAEKVEILKKWIDQGAQNN